MTLAEAYIQLEVPQGSPLADVEASYRKLVRVWHPDRFSSSPDLHATAEAKLKTLNAALEVIRRHVEQTTNSQSTKSPPPTELRYQDSAQYRGDDPRFAKVSPVELLSGGRPAAVEITPQGITLVTLVNGKAHEVVRYSHEQIQSIVSANSTDIWITTTDPERIVQGRILVMLHMRSNYYALLFLKRYTELIGPIPTVPPPPKPEPTPPAKPHPIDFSIGAPEILFGMGALTIIICLLASSRGPLKAKTREVQPYVVTGESSIPAQHAEAQIEQRPSFVAKMPTGGKSKGSFSAWTLPNIPVPGEVYSIVIRIKLPANTTRYDVSDINGSVDTSEVVPSTTPFRLWIPFDGKQPKSMFTERNGQAVKVNAGDQLPIIDGHVQLMLMMPALRPSTSSRINIGVASKLLNEAQDLEFTYFEFR